MKFLALRWHVDGVEHCLVDSVNPGNVEERYRFMRQAFPGNEARLEMVEIPDSRLADTLVPPADPFSHEALEPVGRSAMETLPDSVQYNNEIDNARHGITLVEQDR